MAGKCTVGMFAMGALLCTFLATILAMVLARFAARPARAFALATVVLTALSLAVPLSAAGTAAATRLTLAGAHLLAAAIIIPTVSRRLTRPRGASQTADSSGV
jgi:heme A synthase